VRAAICVLACGLVAAAAVVGRPVGLGVSVVAVTVFAIAAAAARRTDAWSIVWWLGAIALATVATLRTAGWVVWPALVSAAAMATLAASGGATWRQLAENVTRLIRLDGALAALRPAVAVRPGVEYKPALAGAGAAAVLLGIFVPLFASADAAFAHLLAETLPNSAGERPFERTGTFLLVAAAGGALLFAGRAGTPRAGEPTTPLRLARAAWAPPLAALVALFAAFVALQVTTLYGGHDYVLRTAGLTYAEYAREGFVQLMVAAALSLAVIGAAARLIDGGVLKRVLLGALCALTLLVLASALTRLGLYEDAYGLTRLRLAAHVTILWLAGLFALVLLAGAARRSAWLPRATAALTGATVLAFALADPDRRIAEYNVERTGRVDQGYLAGLSADAVPALAGLPACARIKRELARPDGLAGFNLARQRARRIAC
jgi:hypothetical protein